MSLHIQSDGKTTVCRILDSENDNPIELNVGYAEAGFVSIGLENKDNGSDEMWIKVDVRDLRAALAVIDVPRFSVADE